MSHAKRISDATMAVRDAVYAGLLVRRDEVLTEEVARERANNISVAVIEALHTLADAYRGAVPKTPMCASCGDSGKWSSLPGIVRGGDCLDCGGDTPVPRLVEEDRPSPDGDDPRIT
jgi:hypothetical protein